MTPIAKPQRHKGTKKFGNEGSDPSLPNFFVPLCLCGFAIISILLTSTVSNAQDRAFLTQYCIGCHNEKAKTAGLMLDKMDIEHVGESAETWEKVVRKLRTGMMPPSGARRPDRSAIDAFTSNLETALDRAASARPNPGTTALHRLNRTEYANAIRDLLALPVDSTTLLPGDDSADGFDNVADVLGVSPLLIQGYVSAAAKVSRLAVGDPETSPEKITFRIPRGLSQVDHIEGLPLGTRGGMLIRHNFPLDGEYDFRVVRAGPGLGQTQVGGDEEIEISVNGERAFLIGRDAPRDIRLQMKAGPQSIGIAIIRKKNARGVDDLYEVLNGSAGLLNVAITGPFNASGAGDTPSRRRIFVCRPTLNDEVTCARQILKTIARRAFRQPVTDADVAMETLLSFYQTGRAQGGFDTGIQYALARVLVDPRFLYRFEHEPANLATGTVYRLTDLEVASRLSFFLWSSIPDDELLDVASRGKLSDPAVLERQVRRMLADPRSQALVDNFAGQWLFLRDLKNAKPDADGFDENLRHSLRRETEMLFESIIREDRSIVDLLNADYTFVDERLARHYGIPNIRGSQFRRVTLKENDARRGLLGQGSILLVTSAVNRTSPVSRGKWILENILGVPAPAVPASVPPLKENSERTDGKVLSMRERMEEHRTNPGCASCHKIMDPIGFALENFDLTGKWRNVDGNKPVDAAGELVDGTKLDGPASLRQALVSRSNAFVSNATQKLLTYALGRTVHYYDMPVIRSIIRDAAGNDYRFSSLVLGIVKSAPFQMKAK